MPVYRTQHDHEDRVREIEAPAVGHAAARAAVHRARLAWPTTAAAATAELDQLAAALADAGVIVEHDGQDLVLPSLTSGPEPAGIRVHTTGHAPHALYVITADDLAPLTHAGGVLVYLQPLIDAATRGCEGCGADPNELCLPNCVPNPSTT
ncbi:hypothetical protein [Streptomyces sp. RKAG293]|uniref:hypothetical protein n=1 Tax=Streptomyces sp. RKAG293 TaxID=2893403 RepID=UPI002033CC0A|nr:hypothetical protein [Streptomyces sp. RKAG293]MCM2424150.1 hypothetical protein [Streptomyces sp. RKAG293]